MASCTSLAGTSDHGFYRGFIMVKKILCKERLTEVSGCAAPDGLQLRVRDRYAGKPAIG
jgi:hypothetical protein